MSQLRLGRELTQRAEEQVLPPGSSWTEPLTGMEFVWIPPGSFWMGANEADVDEYNSGGSESPRHNVRIKKGFWMGNIR